MPRPPAAVGGAQARLAVGNTDGVLRVSVSLEDAGAVVEDVERALLDQPHRVTSLDTAGDITDRPGNPCIRWGGQHQRLGPCSLRCVAVEERASKSKTGANNRT